MSELGGREAARWAELLAAEPCEQTPLLDVARGNEPLRAEFLARLTEVMDSGRFVFGPDVQALEEELAQLSGAAHGIGCASGSDALLLALMALDIGPGDEVIVPSFTFFATASCVTRLGATPVFVDIEPETFNLSAATVRPAITSRTKAVIPVHLFGQCVEMGPLTALAREHGLAVVEDVAQAIGARDGEQTAGGMGELACFSFYPTKNLGGFGDGGMITTQSAELADRCQLLRGHGMRPRYHHSVIGINSRLDTLQAAALRVKLPHLGRWTAMRRENAAKYAGLFAAAEIEEALPPRERTAMGHVWNQYTIRVGRGRRDGLRQHLQEHGVGSEIYYPVPLHRQPCFAAYAPSQPLLATDQAAEEVLSLPIFPELTEREQATVVRRIAEFFAAARPRRPKFLGAANAPSWAAAPTT